MNFDRKWLTSSTTGTGVAAILGTLAAVLSGAMTWQAAAGSLVGGLFLIFFPQHRNEQDNVARIAAEVAAEIAAMVAARHTQAALEQKKDETRPDDGRG